MRKSPRKVKVTTGSASASGRQNVDYIRQDVDRSVKDGVSTKRKFRPLGTAG